MINFGILIITVPLLNLAEISSILILLSNLTVFTHFPFFKFSDDDELRDPAAGFL